MTPTRRGPISEAGNEKSRNHTVDVPNPKALVTVWVMFETHAIESQFLMADRAVVEENYSICNPRALSMLLRAKRSEQRRWLVVKGDISRLCNTRGAGGRGALRGVTLEGLARPVIYARC
jgi:hypothetical protein